jgi:acetolactate synthase regulatory subunit
MNWLIHVLLISATAIIACGCQMNSRDQVLASEKSQVQLRAVSTRAFDTTDRNLTVRNVIATLQDLGFVVDKADEALGTVSATKMAGYVLRITVIVRPRGQRQMLVRASAQYNMEAVSDPSPYQQFFAALEKAMFLTANEVD